MPDAERTAGSLHRAGSASRWTRKDLQRWLQNARKRFAYWNEGCRRTGSKAHEMKELYAADIGRLKAELKALSAVRSGALSDDEPTTNKNICVK